MSKSHTELITCPNCNSVQQFEMWDSVNVSVDPELGALAGLIREQGKTEIMSVGAGSLNQTIKAIAIARGFVAPGGVDLICIPVFCDIEIDGEERTAIKLIVEAR